MLTITMPNNLQTRALSRCNFCARITSDCGNIFKCKDLKAAYTYTVNYLVLL